MLLYTDKIFSIFMCAQTGDNQVCTLEAPSKSLGYKIMPSEVRLEDLGDSNVNKIQNILKIRGVKGSILLDLFPKRGTRVPRAPLATAPISFKVQAI